MSHACQEAIYYLEHGNVSAKGLYIGQHQTPVIFSEKSQKINNAYIISK